MYELDAVNRLEAVRATGLIDGGTPEGFDDLVALAAHLLRAPIAHISLLDDRRQVFVSKLGMPPPLATRREIDVTHALCRTPVTTNAPLVIGDLRFDARVDPTDAQLAHELLGVVAYVGVPIHAHGLPVGVVCVIDTVERSWTDEDLRLLARVAALTSHELARRVAVAEAGRDLSRLRDAQRELERSATRDELTGACNRRGVLEHAELALRRAERTGLPVALIYLDLDGFKAINDRLGHATGDLALQRFAAILRDTFRAADVIGRLGGDEFVVVASDYHDDDDGTVIRERLSAALEVANRTSHLPFRLAASAGIAVHRPDTAPRSLDELLADADQRMYEAKRARRSRRAPGLLAPSRRARRRLARRRATSRVSTTPPARVRLRRDSVAA